ncbi:hypothetical protein ACO0QE_001523 [Hanseniaspora vineae]
MVELTREDHLFIEQNDLIFLDELIDTVSKYFSTNNHENYMISHEECFLILDILLMLFHIDTANYLPDITSLWMKLASCRTGCNQTSEKFCASKSLKLCKKYYECLNKGLSVTYPMVFKEVLQEPPYSLHFQHHHQNNGSTKNGVPHAETKDSSITQNGVTNVEKTHQVPNVWVSHFRSVLQKDLHFMFMDCYALDPLGVLQTCISILDTFIQLDTVFENQRSLDLEGDILRRIRLNKLHENAKIMEMETFIIKLVVHLSFKPDTQNFNVEGEKFALHIYNMDDTSAPFAVARFLAYCCIPEKSFYSIIEEQVYKYEVPYWYEPYKVTLHYFEKVKACQKEPLTKPSFGLAEKNVFVQEVVPELLKALSEFDKNLRNDSSTTETIKKTYSEVTLSDILDSNFKERLFLKLQYDFKNLIRLEHPNRSSYLHLSQLLDLFAMIAENGSKNFWLLKLDGLFTNERSDLIKTLEKMLEEHFVDIETREHSILKGARQSGTRAEDGNNDNIIKQSSKILYRIMKDNGETKFKGVFNRNNQFDYLNNEQSIFYINCQSSPLIQYFKNYLIYHTANIKLLNSMDLGHNLPKVFSSDLTVSMCKFLRVMSRSINSLKVYFTDEDLSKVLLDVIEQDLKLISQISVQNKYDCEACSSELKVLQEVTGLVSNLAIDFSPLKSSLIKFGLLDLLNKLLDTIIMQQQNSSGLPSSSKNDSLTFTVLRVLRNSSFALAFVTSKTVSDHQKPLNDFDLTKILFFINSENIEIQKEVFYFLSNLTCPSCGFDIDKLLKLFLTDSDSINHKKTCYFFQFLASKLTKIRANNNSTAKRIVSPVLQIILNISLHDDDFKKSMILQSRELMINIKCILEDISMSKTGKDKDEPSVKEISLKILKSLLESNSDLQFYKKYKMNKRKFSGSEEEENDGSEEDDDEDVNLSDDEIETEDNDERSIVSGYPENAISDEEHEDLIDQTKYSGGQSEDNIISKWGPPSQIMLEENSDYPQLQFDTAQQTINTAHTGSSSSAPRWASTNKSNSHSKNFAAHHAKNKFLYFDERKQEMLGLGFANVLKSLLLTDSSDPGLAPIINILISKLDIAPRRPRLSSSDY